MKILMAAMLLALASSSAWAKVESASGSADDRAQACERAKSNAAAKCNAYKVVGVDKYERCECSDDKSNGKVKIWECTVDAYCSESQPDMADEIRRSLSNSGAK